MRESQSIVTAGVDVGSECVKVVVLGDEENVIGRSTVPTRGYFESCVQEALAAALDDASISRDELTRLCATGMGASAVPDHDQAARDISCHVLTARRHSPGAMSVIDLGGRDPKVINVDEEGRSIECRSIRKCAVGIGSFLMYAARHLDVHPTQLQELAAAAVKPARISSYCSVFGSSELLEQLRDGATREDIALGAMHSIAERVVEVGGLRAPLIITGGVAEYFPGVHKAIGGLSGLPVKVVPDPIGAGALGAALLAREEACCHDTA
ncbi:MAG: acyl-CoA dehydratase activase [Acidobacteriota bacterium]|nr:acyl-CoA dehydratase activase [Acidobacteriota bacterium]